MLKVGLITGLQSWLQSCNPRCSADLGSQVPCRPGIRTGSSVWDWYWRNKYLAPRFFCAHLHNLTNSNPPLPLDPCNALRLCNTHTHTHDVRTGWHSRVRTHRIKFKEKAGHLERIAETLAYNERDSAQKSGIRTKKKHGQHA